MNTNFSFNKEDLINKINKANDEFFGTGEIIELSEVEQAFYDLYNLSNNFEERLNFYKFSHELNEEVLLKYYNHQKRCSDIESFIVFKIVQGKIRNSEIPYNTPVFVISRSQGILAFHELIDKDQYDTDIGNDYFVSGYSRTIDEGYYLSNDSIIHDRENSSTTYIRPTDEEIEQFVNKFLEIVPNNWKEIYDRRDCLRRLFNIEQICNYTVGFKE